MDLLKVINNGGITQAFDEIHPDFQKQIDLLEADLIDEKMNDALSNVATYALLRATQHIQDRIQKPLLKIIPNYDGTPITTFELMYGGFSAFFFAEVLYKYTITNTRSSEIYTFEYLANKGDKDSKKYKYEYDNLKKNIRLYWYYLFLSKCSTRHLNFLTMLKDRNYKMDNLSGKMFEQMRWTFMQLPHAKKTIEQNGYGIEKLAVYKELTEEGIKLLTNVQKQAIKNMIYFKRLIKDLLP